MAKWIFIELLYTVVCNDVYDSGLVIVSYMLLGICTASCVIGFIFDNKADKILFTKMNADAVIPTKRVEDVGYDIYPSFEEREIRIAPGETKMIPTGIRSAFDSKYGIILKERGSTGVKGMGVRAGVIDSGFRNEWKVVITNHNKDKDIVITKDATPISDEHTIRYPYHKAICQAVIVEMPEVKVKENAAKDVDAVKSERGDGMLGSSGK